MSLWETFFGRKKGGSALDLDSVRHEEKRLELREAQLVSQLEKLDGEKEKLFTEGAKTKSLARRKLYARRFSDVVARIGMLDRELNRGSKELMTLGRLRSILERTQSPLGSILSGVGEQQAAELQRLLEDDKISEELYLQKLDGLLGLATDTAYEPQDIGADGLEVLKTWEAMDEVTDEDLEAAPRSIAKRREKKKTLPEEDRPR